MIVESTEQDRVDGLGLQPRFRNWASAARWPATGLAAVSHEAERSRGYDRRVSHPDRSAPADLRPIEPGEVWENPVTGECALLLELPWQNTEGRVVAELTALPGARVVGEHLHPALHERFSVRGGNLTVVRNGQRSVLQAGESAHIEPGVWHDWWNEAEVDAVVRVEVTPGERFCAHDRDAVRARARGARQRQRDAEPITAGADRAGVLGRGRVPQAATGCPAPCVRRADADRHPARLPRHLPPVSRAQATSSAEVVV